MNSKEWALEVLRVLTTQPADTTPERIKANRSYGEMEIGGRRWKDRVDVPTKIEGMGKAYREKVVLVTPAEKELKKLLDEWYHYFDEGYRAVRSIDDLPGLIIKKCEEIIQE